VKVEVAGKYAKARPPLVLTLRSLHQYRSFFARASAATGTSRTSRATAEPLPDRRGHEIGETSSMVSTPSFAELASHPDLLLRLHREAGDCSRRGGWCQICALRHECASTSSNADFAPAGQIYLYSTFDILPYTDRTRNSWIQRIQVFFDGLPAKEVSHVPRTPLPHTAGGQPGDSKLKTAWGQPLLCGARPVRLTDAGTLLRDYAERLINLLDEVKKRPFRTDRLNRGELALGVTKLHPCGYCRRWSVQKTPSGIQIRVHACFSRDIPHEVLNYRLDLGAVSFVPANPIASHGDFERRVDTRCAPKHPLARRREVDVSDLESESFVAQQCGIAISASRDEFVCRNRTTLNSHRKPPSKASSASCKWAWA